MATVDIYLNKNSSNDRFAVRINGALAFRGHSIGPAKLVTIIRNLGQYNSSYLMVNTQYVDDVERA